VAQADVMRDVIELQSGINRLQVSYISSWGGMCVPWPHDQGTGLMQIRPLHFSLSTNRLKMVSH